VAKYHAGMRFARPCAYHQSDDNAADNAAAESGPQIFGLVLIAALVLIVALGAIDMGRSQNNRRSDPRRLI
jgi:hypothetical protein